MAAITYDMNLDVKDALKSLTKFNKGLKKTDKNFNKVDKSSKSFGKSLGGLKTALVGVVGSLGLGALIKASIESADSLGKVANKVGLSVKALQEFRYEADLAGVASNTFDTAIQRFARRMGEAAQGTGVLKDTFKELNISIRNQDGSLRDVADVYLEYGDAIRNASSAQEKLLLANKAFDTEGAKLVNIFNDTAEASKRLREEAPKLTKEHTIAAAKAVDAWTKLQKTFANIIQQVSISLTPVIIKLAEDLRAFAENEEAIKALADGMKAFANGVIIAAQALKTLFDNLKPFLIAFLTLKVAMKGGVFTKMLDSTRGITRGFSLAKSSTVKWGLALGALRKVAINLVLMFTRLTVVGLGIWAVVTAFQALFGVVSDTDDAMGKLNNSTAEFTGKDIDVLIDKLVRVNDEILTMRKIAKAKGGMNGLATKQLEELEKEQQILVKAIAKGNERIAAEKAKANEPVKGNEPAVLPGLVSQNDNSAAEAAKARAESVRQLGLSFLPLKQAQEDYMANLKALQEIEITSTFTEQDKENAIRGAAKAYSEQIKQIKGITLATESYKAEQEALNDELKATAEQYTPIITQQKKFEETQKKLNLALKKGILTQKQYGIATKNLKKEMKAFADQQLQNSRKWGDGWKRAMNAYVEDATNAAQQAERVFQTATQGMEDAIVGFAKTGKFEWKSFLDDIVTQMLRSQIKQTMASLFTMPTPSVPSGGSSSGGSSSGGSSSSSIWGAVGDFFGGFFADGGNLSAGKWGIVGEAGPEIISGPATITPMSGGSGQTAITYNINAVDAQSFKQMIARDPKFLFAVTEEGRRGLPQYR